MPSLRRRDSQESMPSGCHPNLRFSSLVSTTQTSKLGQWEVHPHRHPQPRSRSPAPRLAARRPLAAAQGKPRPKGKSCSWDSEGLGWGGGVGELAARRGKALSFPLFGPRAARFCCNLDRGRKGHERGRGDRGAFLSLGGGLRLANGNGAPASAQEPRRGTQSRGQGLRTRGPPSK